MSQMLNCSITRPRISFSSCSACRHDGKPAQAKLFVQDPALVGADGIAPATNLFNVYLRPEPGVVNDPCWIVACRTVGATLTVWV